MKKKFKILGIIPARGGSKGIPGKNIKKLNGKPLIFYTINEAKKSKFLDNIIVSTEDNKIEKVAKKYGIEVVKRPKKLSTDNSTSISVLKHTIINLEKTKKFFPDIIVMLQPTSPLRKSSDIDLAIEKFLKTDCDTIIGVTEVQHPPYWTYYIENGRLIPIIEGGEKIFRRQDSKKFYQINGAIYIISRNKILKQDSIISKNNFPYIMPPQRSIDIDNEMDFKLAELLLEEKLK